MSRSGYTKVRHRFVQKPGTATRSSRPGTLAKLTRNRRAIILYLALLTNWPWLNREDDPLPAAVWVRFLSSDQPGALTWTKQSVSDAWRQLEDLGLIARTKGRTPAVRPRREDGQTDYKPPTGDNGDSYFTLPHAFWLEGHFATLELPALIVLLILLKESGKTPEAELAIDRAQTWYGISRTTAEEGLTKLRKAGLVHSRERKVRDARSGEGRRRTSLHTLLTPYSTTERAALRSAAKLRVDERASTKFADDEEADGAKPEEAAL